jgi:hypothetical protein
VLARGAGTSLAGQCCNVAVILDKYEVSQAIGERVLLPAIRQESAETLINTDGFSCREQITQATGRNAIHLAEVLQLARNARRAP